MTLGIWTLYLYIITYGGTSTPATSTIVHHFNTKEDCINTGNLLIKKFDYAHSISSICIESKF